MASGKHIDKVVITTQTSSTYDLLRISSTDLLEHK